MVPAEANDKIREGDKVCQGERSDRGRLHGDNREQTWGAEGEMSRVALRVDTWEQNPV